MRKLIILLLFIPLVSFGQDNKNASIETFTKFPKKEATAFERAQIAIEYDGNPILWDTMFPDEIKAVNFYDSSREVILKIVSSKINKSNPIKYSIHLHNFDFFIDFNQINSPRDLDFLFEYAIDDFALGPLVLPSPFTQGFGFIKDPETQKKDSGKFGTSNNVWPFKEFDVDIEKDDKKVSDFIYNLKKGKKLYIQLDKINYFGKNEKDKIKVEAYNNIIKKKLDRIYEFDLTGSSKALSF